MDTYKTCKWSYYFSIVKAINIGIAVYNLFDLDYGISTEVAATLECLILREYFSHCLYHLHFYILLL